MDRREFVRIVMAAAAAAGSQSVYAQSPNPPVLFGATAASKILPIDAKRYDGASGTAIFNGAIPLQMGQLMPTAIPNVSIWQGSTELPINVNPLNGVHPDGSLKSLQVQTEISAANETVVPLILRLDIAPSAGTFSQETIDYLWCENPRFLYSPDAEHLCASRIAPLPLVPMDSPSLPDSWKTFLTTTADNFLSQVNNGGTASYNWGYGWCCRYLMTGDIQPLRDALLAIVDRTPSKYSPSLANYTAAPNGNYTVDVEPGNNNYFNPDNYPDTGGGLSPEWYDSSADFFLMYYLSGWEHARRCLILQGAWQAGNLQDDHNTSIRREIRQEFMIPALSYIMQNDVRVRSISGGWNNNVMDQSVPFAKVANIEAAANAIDAGFFNSGVWGASSSVDHVWEGAPSVGIQPLFQYEMMFPAMMMYYLNIEQAPSIPDGLAGVADYLITQWKGPFVDGSGSWYSQQDYHETDPSLVTQEDTGGKAYPYMLFPILAYAYSHTGDTNLRNIVDHLVSQDVSARGAMGGETKQGKITGQMYAYAYHAAAYRAGVPSTGWDIA